MAFTPITAKTLQKKQKYAIKNGRRDRQTDRHTDRQRQKQRETEAARQRLWARIKTASL